MGEKDGTVSPTNASSIIMPARVDSRVCPQCVRDGKTKKPLPHDLRLGCVVVALGRAPGCPSPPVLIALGILLAWPMMA